MSRFAVQVYIHVMALAFTFAECRAREFGLWATVSWLVAAHAMSHILCAAARSKWDVQDHAKASRLKEGQDRIIREEMRGGR